MDIAMVFDGLAVGGVERVGAAYARLLRELGHSVTVFNLRPAYTEFASEFPADCVMESVDFPSYRAPEGCVNHAWRDARGRAAYPVRYTARSLRCRILRRTLQRCPALAREYDLAIAFSGHFSDLTFVAERFVRAKTALCWLHGALYQYLLLSPGYYNLYKKIQNLVVLVDDAQEEVLAYHPAPLRIRKLYNPTFMSGARPDEVAAAALREAYGDYLLMVARCSYPHKDHYTVIEALRILRERYGDELELVFVGSGPDEEKIRAFAREQGEELASHIHFMGDRSDVQDFYAGARMLVHASVAGEGLPTVMLEALAFDLPMVVTDSKVGPREILRDNEYGLLCRVRDPEDMAEKIHRLHTDEALRRTFRERSAERLADFTPDAARARLTRLLEELAAE